MGSLAAASWDTNLWMLAVAVLGALFFWTQYRTLNLMLLGDEAAVTLGTDLHRWRIVYLLAASLLVGFAVYTAGIIGFVGLVIPHVVRILFGTDHKKLIPISALLGAIFLLWSDVLCRVVLPGKEIPIGVLTALVGAPVFIYLMARKKYGFGGGD
jgi:iron complex transport system permease protein